MAVKDRYGNNIRRGGRVTDLREGTGRRREGAAVATYDRQVVVQWDDGEEEQVRAADLRSESQGFRR